MKNNIGFVAIGQGGGNIGAAFEKMGYGVLYVNTSKEDLATLKGMEHIYHIKGGEGSNKDRDKAKRLAFDNHAGIVNKIGQAVREDVVFAIFTAGGGTGSGSAPMLIEYLLKHTDKQVGAICVLPARTEPLKAHINAYECFEELEALEGLGATFVLDNAKADKFSINREFAELFDAFASIPQSSSAKDNIDTAEIKEMLATRGAAVISAMPKEASDAARLVKSFKENIFAPMEGDGVIAYIGLSSPAHIDVEAVVKATGTPLDIFQGSNSESTVCMLCGLSYPYTELAAMRERVEVDRDSVANSLASTRETRLSAGVNFLGGIAGTKDRKPAGKESVADVFSKYIKK